jgi:hypothetical protein
MSQRLEDPRFVLAALAMTECRSQIFNLNFQFAIPKGVPAACVLIALADGSFAAMFLSD